MIQKIVRSLLFILICLTLIGCFENPGLTSLNSESAQATVNSLRARETAVASATAFAIQVRQHEESAAAEATLQAQQQAIIQLTRTFEETVLLPQQLAESAARQTVVAGEARATTAAIDRLMERDTAQLQLEQNHNLLDTQQRQVRIKREQQWNEIWLPTLIISAICVVSALVLTFIWRSVQMVELKKRSGTGSALTVTENPEIPEAIWNIFATWHDKTTIPIGMTTQGVLAWNPQYDPHIMIAGRTGKGKSTGGAKTIITGLLGLGYSGMIINGRANDYSIFKAQRSVVVAPKLKEEETAAMVEDIFNALQREVTIRDTILEKQNKGTWHEVDNYQGRSGPMFLVIEEAVDIFEELGANGWLALKRLMRNSRRCGISIILVLQDSTRRNIGAEGKNVIEQAAVMAFGLQNAGLSRTLINSETAVGLPIGQYVTRLTGEELIAKAFKPSDKEIYDYLQRRSNNQLRVLESIAHPVNSRVGMKIPAPAPTLQIDKPEMAVANGTAGVPLVQMKKYEKMAADIQEVDEYIKPGMSCRGILVQLEQNGVGSWHTNGVSTSRLQEVLRYLARHGSVKAKEIRGYPWGIYDIEHEQTTYYA